MMFYWLFNTDKGLITFFFMYSYCGCSYWYDNWFNMASKMTPERLRECLTALCWSQRGLARNLNKAEGTVRQWARGKLSIPEDVAVWLERCGRFMEENPPPPRN